MDTLILRNAEVQWGDDGLPRSGEFDDIYFSAGDPAGESRHVFFQGNAIAQRLAVARKPAFTIGETGFGFGLNFILSWQLFETAARPDARLHYLGTELHPVGREDLLRFSRSLPRELRHLYTRLLEQYPEQGRGCHRLVFTGNGKPVILDLHYGDAATALDGLDACAGVDAWFLDGFSPRKNSAMWDGKLCRAIARLSRPGTTFATYSASGQLRANLAATGFQVDKAPGFGRKRHMCRGRFMAGDGSPVTDGVKSVVVIGAGLAGCATAHALARRGCRVTLIEERSAVATLASGNSRGVLHCRPARQLTPACRYFLHAWRHALRHYRVFSQDHDFDWHACGLLHLAADGQEQAFQQDLLDRALYPPGWIRTADNQEAIRLGGIPLAGDGLFYPEGGWLNPQRLCHAYIEHGNIHLMTGTRLDTCRHDGDQWQIRLGNRQTLSADTLVLCTNGRLPDIPGLHYPLAFTGGQVEHVEAGSLAQALKTVVCGQGYVIPGGDSGIVFGGSHARHVGPAHHPHWHRDMNLRLLESLSPALAKDVKASGVRISSRSGLRCHTRDRLPLVGPAEDRQACIQRFSYLRQNARSALAADPVHLPGLYLNTAHGAHGLTTTPLAAEMIASTICGEFAPMERSLQQAVTPLRFLLRDLKRQQA